MTSPRKSRPRRRQIATRASQAEVIKLLGEPFDVVACAEFGGRPPEGCKKEFSYVSAATFWDVWEVSFDANDRVIRNLRYAWWAAAFHFSDASASTRLDFRSLLIAVICSCAKEGEDDAR